METKRVLLIDDHTATREEIASLVQADDDLEVVGQASSGEEGVQMAEDLHPDVVLMDMEMPGMNGIAATKAIRASDTKVYILAVSNHTHSTLVDVALRAGANGYMRKDCAYEELSPAIHTVLKGDRYVGPSILV